MFVNHHLLTSSPWSTFFIRELPRGYIFNRSWNYISQKAGSLFIGYTNRVYHKNAHCVALHTFSLWTDSAVRGYMHPTLEIQTDWAVRGSFNRNLALFLSVDFILYSKRNLRWFWIWNQKYIFAYALLTKTGFRPILISCLKVKVWSMNMIVVIFIPLSF